MDWYSTEASSRPGLGKALDRATVAIGGALTEKHQWLQQGVDKWRTEKAQAVQPAASTSLKKKRVLLLGSGMVAGPAVDHIAQRKDVELVVGP